MFRIFSLSCAHKSDTVQTPRSFPMNIKTFHSHARTRAISFNCLALTPYTLSPFFQTCAYKSYIVQTTRSYALHLTPFYQPCAHKSDVVKTSRFYPMYFEPTPSRTQDNHPGGRSGSTICGERGPMARSLARRQTHSPRTSQEVACESKRTAGKTSKNMSHQRATTNQRGQPSACGCTVHSNL